MRAEDLTQDMMSFVDERRRQLFFKGLELIKPLTRGVRLVNESMLQRHLQIDFREAQWLLQQLQLSESQAV